MSRDLLLGVFDIDGFHSQSARAAALASEFGRQCRQPDSDCEEFRLAGLLHDIGRLALAVTAPDEYGQLSLLAEQTGRPLWQVEQRVLGVDHMQAGGFLASIWGLPESTLEAAEFHHEPRRSRLRDGLSALSAVYAAVACQESSFTPDHCYLQDAGLDRAFEQLLSARPSQPVKVC